MLRLILFKPTLETPAQLLKYLSVRPPLYRALLTSSPPPPRHLARAFHRSGRTCPFGAGIAALFHGWGSERRAESIGDLVEVGCPKAEGGIRDDVVVAHAHQPQLLPPTAPRISLSLLLETRRAGPCEDTETQRNDPKQSTGRPCSAMSHT